MPVSPNGWPISPPRTARTVPGTSVKLVVADGPIGDVLIYVAEQFNRRVEPLGPSVDDWAYSYRPNVNNPTVWSEHAAAAAIDLNALLHPNGRANTFSTAQFAEIRKILAEVDNCVIQLLGYDEMHFEVKGPLSRVQAAASKIKGGAPKPTTVKPTTKPTIKSGSQGEDVKLVQRFLGVANEGSPGYGNFGPATLAAVVKYQRSQGLSADGVVGPATWERIVSGLGGASSSNSGTSSGVRPTLRRGSTGAEVEKLQAFLNRAFPSYSRLSVDGAYGPGTEAVVREFQRRSGLPETGVVDAGTWKRLGF